MTETELFATVLILIYLGLGFVLRTLLTGIGVRSQKRIILEKVARWVDRLISKIFRPDGSKKKPHPALPVVSQGGIPLGKVFVSGLDDKNGRYAMYMASLGSKYKNAFLVDEIGQMDVPVRKEVRSLFGRPPYLHWTEVSAFLAAGLQGVEVRDLQPPAWAKNHPPLVTTKAASRLWFHGEVEKWLDENQDQGYIIGFDPYMDQETKKVIEMKKYWEDCATDLAGIPKELLGNDGNETELYWSQAGVCTQCEDLKVNCKCFDHE